MFLTDVKLFALVFSIVLVLVSRKLTKSAGRAISHFKHDWTTFEGKGMVHGGPWSLTPKELYQEKF